MKTAHRILLSTLAVVSWATAEVPKKAPITKYISLWTNSNITDKPTPVDSGPPPNPLEDYALLGVSPISSGYRVTLINKKKPDDRVTVNSDDTKGDYKILEVTRKPGDPLGTVVRMQAGPVTGTVSFDDKLLVIAAPKAAPKPAAAPPVPAIQPPQQLAQPNAAANAASRMPRPRVVPPTPAAPTPAPSSNQGSQTGSRSSRGGRGSYGR